MGDFLIELCTLTARDDLLVAGKAKKHAMFFHLFSLCCFTLGKLSIGSLAVLCKQAETNKEK